MVFAALVLMAGAGLRIGPADVSAARRFGWLALCLGACGDPAGDRVLPDVTVEAGVEVASLKALPSPLDESRLWTLRPVRQVRTGGEAAGEPWLYLPRSVLELREGLLLVHDPMGSRPLVLLDPAAPAVTARFGRDGHGPGELGQDVALSDGPGDELVVADRENLQLHRFARSGEWLGSERLELEGVPLAGGFQAGPGRGQVLAFLLHQDDRSRWNGLAEIDVGSGTSKPFVAFPELPRDVETGTIHRGRQLWAVVGDHVVAMWSADPTVTVFDGRGRTVRRIALPLSQSRLTASDIEREIARVGPVARRLEPGPRPLTNMLYAVNDTVFGMFLSALWHAAEDPPLPSGTIYWRLFTLGGEYLGVVEQPEGFRFLGRGPGTVWASLLDDTAHPVLTELALARMNRKE